MIWTMHAPVSLLTIYRARVMPDEKKRNVAVILMEDKTNRWGGSGGLGGITGRRNDG